MNSDKDIRKKFQSKFSGFEVPIPIDGWESLERSLNAAAAAKSAVRRRWYIGSVAAVFVLLIGSVLFLQIPGEPTDSLITETKPITSNNDKISEIGTEMTAVTNPIDKKAVNSPSRSHSVFNKRVNVKTPPKQLIRDLSPDGMLAKLLDNQQKQIEDKMMKNIDGLATLKELDDIGLEQNANELQEEQVIRYMGQEETLYAGRYAAHKEHKNLLLAINSRGGLTGYQQTVNSPMTLRSAEVTNDEKYKLEPNGLQMQAYSAAGNVAEMEHDQPVSFGITVSKYLLEDFSIETGLVYSYLHSKTRNTNNIFKSEEEQKLYYLGIPLNVNYNIISLRGLNVYASMGGMIEKDVYGEFRKVKEGQVVNLNSSEESEENEITKISQHKPQFSFNAGVGVSYPIYDRLRLYGKIGGAYYFDAKNQYKTIYSDRKIVMDLNVGLRYEF